MSDKSDKPARGRPRKMCTKTVLDVAMNAYWQDDPADVSVNAICQMADVSKPSLYRTFGSEDGLTCAVLDRYGETILSDVFAILQQETDIGTMLEALVDFACADRRMESGCLFYKMRAGKHRLGPRTRARIEEIEAAAIAGFQSCLQTRGDEDNGDKSSSTQEAAHYLSEHIALAFTQRASGVDPVLVRKMLRLALSVLINETHNPTHKSA